MIEGASAMNNLILLLSRTLRNRNSYFAHLPGGSASKLAVSRPTLSRRASLREGVVYSSVILIVFGLPGVMGMAMAQEGAAALAATEPVPRLVLAFYYPWYGNPAVAGGSGRRAHWEGIDEANRTIASSTHYPVLGPYDSHHPETIAQHCRWAKESGVDGFIVSWWGHGDFSDLAMPRILDACAKSGLVATVYYETVRPRTVERAVAELTEVLRKYADHPAWLRVLNKPVIFIYARVVEELGLDRCHQAALEVKRTFPSGAVFIVDSLDDRAAAFFDGIHTYNPCGQLQKLEAEKVRLWAQDRYRRWVQTADRHRKISTVTIIPGYDDTKIRKPGISVGRMDGLLYQIQWEEAIRANPDWILITSWNEWHEGSEIEPSVEHGEKYLELTRRFVERFKREGSQRAEP